MKIEDGKITTTAHCCACSGVCYHIGPIMLCAKHGGKPVDNRTIAERIKTL